MALYAVLTGDIVNSTRLNRAQHKKLFNAVQKIFSHVKFEFYRGDSFQAYIKNAPEALKLALLCRTTAMSISKSEQIIFDVRAAVGLGSVIAPVRSLNTAKGEAFVFSGRSFDEMAKKNERLAIVAGKSLANEALQVISAYLDSIFRAMTGKQAEVITELLKGITQQEVSEKFKKTKSTVSQHANAGRWPEIEKLLQQYENIIKHLS